MASYITYKFKDTITTTTEMAKTSVSFLVNGVTYDAMSISNGELKYHYGSYVNSVYISSGWVLSDYKIVHFLGAIPTTIQTYLNANATISPIGIISSVQLTELANAIRDKKGITNSLTIGQMVNNVKTDLVYATGTKNITDTSKTLVRSYEYAQIVDTNLKAENIASGITILGITGTYTGGITPSGKITITNTNEIDVTQYAKAQVVDDDLIGANIINGKTILGVKGTYAGIIPSGKKNITSTISYDVSEYAQAQVVDENLIGENIRFGKTVLGVEGSYTKDGTILADCVEEGKIGYARNMKIVGTLKTYNGEVR